MTTVKVGNTVVKIYHWKGKSGYEQFKVAYRADGQRKRETFGSLAKAKGRANEIAVQIERGERDALRDAARCLARDRDATELARASATRVLEVLDGRYTGDLMAPPLVGEARAAWLRARAAAEGIDLARSYAYADSHSDLPLLMAVGNPVAVNPDVALFRAARARRWPIETWARAGGTPRVLVPERVP